MDPKYLKKLVLDYNRITDISPLAECTSLEYLRLVEIQIKDITPLTNLIFLSSLDLSSNLIEDITPLKNLNYLEWLNLNSNQINDLTPLVENTGLNFGDYLDIRYNSLDLTEGSPDLEAINTLIERGIEVDY
ncbi:leucine-rich repeat domain-containing protein [Anoxybacter fermentans]|uniref:leucine-rich repeat domain-containing protein n=1 Tax=Anoxybacter fermentans TaxID=1323375 RepID=UPI003AB3DA66